MERSSSSCRASCSVNFKPEMVTDNVPPPRCDRVKPEAIAQWILDMPVDALADLILLGVDLDDPPMACVAPLFRAPLPLPRMDWVIE